MKEYLYMENPEPHAAVTAILDAVGIAQEHYTLVNNYGFTFEYKGKKFDMRFWANCYGCYIGEWEIRGKTIRADITAKELFGFLDKIAEKGAN